MKIAIIIATYNGEKYIEEQVESILSQTRKVDKILIFDDCSTDKTFEICKTIEKEHNDVIELHQNEKNLGYRKNFEQALLAARNHDVIFFCDQDDWWFPNKIEVVLTELEKSEKLILFFSNAYIADENLRIDENKILFDFSFNEKKQQQFIKEPEKLLLNGGVVTGCTMAIRNTIIDKVIPFPENWVHDEWIVAISYFLGEINYTNKRLIKYRQHQTQNIGVKASSVLRHSGFAKIKYALSSEAVNKEIKFIDTKLDRFYTLNNFLIKTIFKESKYLKNEINFKESLKESFHKNLFNRIIFFIINNLNGTYRYLDIPFFHRVFYVFLHIQK